MNDSIDAQPLLGPSSRLRLSSPAGGYASLDGMTREFDLSMIPALTAADGLQILDEPAKNEARRAPPPPPSSRPRSETPAPRNIVGGAAAPSGPEKAPRTVTVPKATVPRATGDSPALPSVLINDAARYLGVTQPRERPAVPSDEIVVEPGLVVATIGAGKNRRRALPIAAATVTVVAAMGTVAFLYSRPAVAPLPARPFFASAALVHSASPAAPSLPPAPPPPPAAAPRTAAPPSLPLPPAPAAPAVPPVAATAAADGSSTVSTPSPPPPSASPPSSLAKSLPKRPASEETGAVGREEPAERHEPALESRSSKRAPHPSQASAAPRLPAVAPEQGTESAAVAAAVVEPLTTFAYGSSALFAVATEPKRVTDVTLQAGERLVAHPTAGDSSLWVITVVDAVQQGQPQQHVYIKPLRPHASTSLTMATDRRNYHLELTSSATGQYMAAVQWRYPEDEADRRRRELEQATAEHLDTTRIADAKALRFNYSIRVRAGTPEWKPTMVFDDGVQTFIRFPMRVVPERAPVLLVERTGSARTAEYVNYRIRSDLYVVERLFDTAELRLPDTDGGPDQIVRITRSAP